MFKTNKWCSVVMTTFRTNKNNRGRLAFDSISSLLLTDAGYPFELVLVDNTKNNRGLSLARNVGAKIATGKYIAIVDDDIMFDTPGWLSTCIDIIEQMPKRRVVVTPIHSDKTRVWWKRNFRGQVEGYDWHTRSGSNCMVMRRNVFNCIGPFREDLLVGRGCGTEWHNRLQRRRCKLLLTKMPMATDMALYHRSY